MTQSEFGSTLVMANKFITTKGQVKVKMNRLKDASINCNVTKQASRFLTTNIIH